MITSIVRKVQSLIADSGRSDVVAEIVFPVSPDAISTAGQEAPPHGAPPTLPGGLAVVPGAASGDSPPLRHHHTMRTPALLHSRRIEPSQHVP